MLLMLIIIGGLWLGAAWLLRLRDERRIHHSAGVISSLAALLTLALLPFHSSKIQDWGRLGDAFGGLSFSPDGLGLSLASLAAVIGCLTVIFSRDYMAGEVYTELRRYYALMLLFIGAMIGLVLADSLLLLFFFWELTALCSFALIAYHNDEPQAVAGGLRALIMTQVGGAGLLLSALLIYSYTGSYQISVFLQNPQALPAGALNWIAFGMLAAAAAKSAQVPFHTWLPGAMEAPTPVSALIHAATMVNAGVYLLARFYPAFAPVVGWSEVVMLVGVFSALIGALLALFAFDLKRVLAYSTISQLGYMVYAIGAGGVLASQFHLLSHAIFKALLFLAAGAIIHASHTRDMRQMGGLRHEMPFTRNVFIIGTLGLVGLPIFNGFWSKELILEAGAAHSPRILYGLMLLGVALTALYSLRMLRLVFFGPASRIGYEPIGRAMQISLGLLALGVIFSGLLFSPLTGMLAQTLPHHALHDLSTGDIIREVMNAPATWLTLLIIGLSLALGLSFPPRYLPPSVDLRKLAEHDLGFSRLNQSLVDGTQRGAASLAKLHTGILSWNLLAIVLALLLLSLALEVLR